MWTVLMAINYNKKEDTPMDYITNYITAPDVKNGQLHDDNIRINHLQVIGTHNSCHIAPNPPVLRLLKLFSKEAASLDYTHLPLAEQLEKQNIRQVELDIYADPEGGIFSKRLGKILCGSRINAGLPELESPGFKVLHIPHIDYNTTCLTFKEALSEIKRWSEKNPGHIPVMILLDIKGALPLDTLSQPLRDMIKSLLFLLKLFRLKLPHPISRTELLDLETEILSVFDRSQLITPDEVRGSYPTLEEAVMKNGWPTLKEARGHFLFCIDNDNEVRDLYLEENPTLEGRLMFTNSHPGQPSAGFIRMNDPLENKDLIKSYVRKGFLVRTRADEELIEAKENDTARRDAALESGAHYISTDFPGPDQQGYSVSIPGPVNTVARIIDM